MTTTIEMLDKIFLTVFALVTEAAASIMLMEAMLLLMGDGVGLI